jgi:hypothetical protein
MATEFEVSISGSGKNLLDAIGILAEHGVNLNTIATTRNGNGYNVKFLTGNEEETRRTFIKADLPFKERKVLVVDVFNRPGQWVRAASHLVDAGVEFDGSYLLGQNGDKLRFVFAVNNYDMAKKVAGQFTECSMD